MLQSKGDRYSVLQGDKLRFGTVETVISYHVRHLQVSFYHSSAIHCRRLSEQCRMCCQVIRCTCLHISATGNIACRTDAWPHALLAAKSCACRTVQACLLSSHLVWHALQARSGAAALSASNQGNSHQATEPQGHVSRSPTPDMALAQAPLAQAATTDNDMTLPWDVPPDQQDDEAMEPDHGHSDDAAAQADTQLSDPSHQAEHPLPADTILPDTQANDMATDPQADLHTGLQGTSFAEPTQLVGAPTELMGEPTQLALPVSPLAAAPVALPGSQAGTALASAAAQAMTGAQPSQASVLPSSAGFPTAMPSLAPAQPPSQPATGNTAGATSGLAPATVPAQASGGSGSIPISRPEADAVLHLPSQPSGSQHAAHPHGPPRSPRAGQQSASGPSQPQPQPTAAMDHAQAQTEHGTAASEEAQKDSAAAAAAGSSGHNTLLDSILGHDDDDSIWMPPASLPDSQGPSQGAEPAGSPPQGGHGGKDASLPPPGPVSGAHYTAQTVCLSVHLPVTDMHKSANLQHQALLVTLVLLQFDSAFCGDSCA